MGFINTTGRQHGINDGNNMPSVAITADDMGSSPYPAHKMCKHGVEISWVPAIVKV
jgi:hypothetical protein